MTPLRSATLALLPKTLTPNYSRTLRRRICHIGPGNFHRAHQAWYLHRLLQDGKADSWGICGIFLMPGDRQLLRRLKRQDGLYSLWQLGEGIQSTEIVGSLMELIDATQSSDQAISVLLDRDTKIVSLTITEKGYCLNEHNQLDINHPAIIADLANPSKPRTAVGLIVRALQLRKESDLAAFTVMSCDNLIENGHKTRSAVLGYAARLDASLERWIDSHVHFPNSMVDRITPVPNPDQQQHLLQRADFQDEALLYSEPWHQWVIEDTFGSGRPAWEQAGATLSDQVSLYEDMKISLLNGGHSVLSHRALLAGFKTVHDAAADPEIAQWLWQYWHAAKDTLQPIAGADYSQYCENLLSRFRNGAIEDQLLRLAEDSRNKLQQCLLPLIKRNLAKGLDIATFTQALAYWIDYLAQDPEGYRDSDPRRLIEEAKSALGQKNSQSFIAFAFGESDPRLAQSVNAALHGLDSAR